MDLRFLLLATLSAVLCGSWAQQGTECSKDEVGTEDLDANCRKDNDTDICSNNGDCVCGTCECKKRDNPAEVYSGKYCECDNFNCDRSNNKLCGGHGRCECRQCICDASYTGSACDCSLDSSSCLATNGQICNGRGICDCGTCKCTDSRFQGPTCELCPTCPGVCAEHKDCVQCRAFQAGDKKDTCDSDCNYFELIKVSDRDKLPQPTDQSYPLSHCKERDANDCWFYFTYAVRNDTKEVVVVEKLECPTDPDIIPIVAGFQLDHKMPRDNLYDSGLNIDGEIILWENDQPAYGTTLPPSGL